MNKSHFLCVENVKIYFEKTFTRSFTSLFHFFNTAEMYCIVKDIYGKHTPLNATFQEWFWRFKNTIPV